MRPEVSGHLKLDKDFQEVFQVPLIHFYSPLYGFALTRFVEWLEGTEEPPKSIVDRIQARYGDRGVQLIKALTN